LPACDRKALPHTTMQSHGLGCLSLTLSNSVPGRLPRTGCRNWFIHVRFIWQLAQSYKQTGQICQSPSWQARGW
jgi:hypothetical protein